MTGLACYLLLLLITLVSLIRSDPWKLNNENFDEMTSQGNKWYIMLGAQWCFKCQKLKPTFSKLCSEMARENQMFFGVVECDLSPEICKRFNAFAYPEFRLILNGNPIPFTGEKNEENLRDFYYDTYEAHLKALEEAKKRQHKLKKKRQLQAASTYHLLDNLPDKTSRLKKDLKATKQSLKKVLSDVKDIANIDV